MGLPKGYKKNLNIFPQKVGVEQRNKLFEDIAKKGTFLPKGVSHEDMDKSFIEFVGGDMKIVADGKEIPVVFLTIQKWSEFSKTWSFSDKFKNIKIPFITIVRKPDPQVGTNQSNYWNIPGKPMFTYMKVPTWDGNRKGMDIYKIPQPTAIDITYEVRMFCNRMRDLNKINKKIINIFRSRQHYIGVNGHPMPLHLETIGDESTISDFENRRFFVQLFEIKLLGYLLDEEEFEVIPAINRALALVETGDKRKKKIAKINEICTEILFDVGINEVVLPITNGVNYTKIEIENIKGVSIEKNSSIINIPLFVVSGDTLEFNIVKNDISKESKIKLKGKTL